MSKKTKKETLSDLEAQARAEERSVEPDVVEAARDVIQQILHAKRDEKQGGYISYQGKGEWSFVSTSLSVTGDDLNALFSFAGMVPDVIVPLGSCRTCRFSMTVEGQTRGWGAPCVRCSMPRHSEWQARPKGWKPEERRP